MLPTNNTVNADCATAQMDLQVTGAFSVGTQPYLTAIASLNQGINDAETVIVAQDTILASAGTPGILGTARAQVAITNLSMFTAAAGLLAGTLQQQAYLGRALSNLVGQ
jgi:hypothetical protein